MEQKINRQAQGAGNASAVAAPARLLAIAEPGMEQTLLYKRLRGLVDQFGCSVELVAFRDDPQIDRDALQVELETSARPYIANSKNFNCQVVHSDNLSGWIIKHCREQHIELVLKIGHRTETVFYQPVDWQLIRGLPCALLLLSQHKWRERPVVMAALDIASDDERQQSINRDVLAWTQLICAGQSAEKHIVSCIELNRALVDLDVIEPSVEQREKEQPAKQALRKFLDSCGFGDAQLWAEVGEPAKKIPSIANREKAALVVMGSVGRKGVKGLLLGNTAEKVLHNIRTDVLIIKPTGQA